MARFALFSSRQDHIHVYLCLDSFYPLQEAAVRNLFSSKVDLSKRGDGFNLGDRDSILDAVEAGPILVHVAIAEGRHYPYEAIMRSVFKHLMDSATSEYLFTIEFFKVGRSERVVCYEVNPPLRVWSSIVECD